MCLLNVSDLEEFSKMIETPTTEVVGNYIFRRSPENYLGEGGFGYVYRGYNSLNPLQQVAIKTIASNQLKARELKVLSTVKSDYLVKLLRIYSCGEITYVVMELCDRDLGDHLSIYSKLNAKNLQLLADNLARGYQIFQTHKIVHRDIKPQNILLKYDGHPEDIRVAKFSDFGTSRQMDCDQSELSNVAGTLQYMAPEVGANLVATKLYDHSADMWSIGCVLFECITGEVPFDENSLCKLFLHVACKNYSSYKKPTLPKSTSSDINFVTLALLDINAQVRLTPNQFYNRLVGRKPLPKTRLCAKKCQSKSYNCFTDDDLRKQPRVKTENRWKTLENGL